MSSIMNKVSTQIIKSLMASLPSEFATKFELDEDKVKEFLEEQLNNEFATGKGKGKTSKASKGKSKQTAYQAFCFAKRSIVKEENEDITFGEIGKKLGEMWKELTDDDKVEWQEKADEKNEENGFEVSKVDQEETKKVTKTKKIDTKAPKKSSKVKTDEPKKKEVEKETKTVKKVPVQERIRMEQIDKKTEEERMLKTKAGQKATAEQKAKTERQKRLEDEREKLMSAQSDDEDD